LASLGVSLEGRGSSQGDSVYYEPRHCASKDTLSELDFAHVCKCVLGRQHTIYSNYRRLQISATHAHFSPSQQQIFGMCSLSLLLSPHVNPSSLSPITSLVAVVTQQSHVPNTRSAAMAPTDCFFGSSSPAASRSAHAPHPCGFCLSNTRISSSPTCFATPICK